MQKCENWKFLEKKSLVWFQCFLGSVSCPIVFSQKDFVQLLFQKQECHHRIRAWWVTFAQGGRDPLHKQWNMQGPKTLRAPCTGSAHTTHNLHPWHHVTPSHPFYTRRPRQAHPTLLPPLPDKKSNTHTHSHTRARTHALWNGDTQGNFAPGPGFGPNIKEPVAFHELKKELVGSVTLPCSVGSHPLLCTEEAKKMKIEISIVRKPARVTGQE